MAVRQRQRHHLQNTLWARAQRRQTVRSSTPHAAGFCELVLQDLQASKGRASRAQPRPGAPLLGDSVVHKVYFMQVPVGLSEICAHLWPAMSLPCSVQEDSRIYLDVGYAIGNSVSTLEEQVDHCQGAVSVASASES